MDITAKPIHKGMVMYLAPMRPTTEVLQSVTSTCGRYIQAGSPRPSTKLDATGLAHRVLYPSHVVLPLRRSSMTGRARIQCSKIPPDIEYCSLLRHRKSGRRLNKCSCDAS
eukprot:scaffold6198_cov408-Prasinococcus_capsulatus_cf.AAC.7